MASHLGPAVAHDAQIAFTDGMQFALICAAGALALAAVGVAALLRGERRQQPQDSHHRETEVETESHGALASN